MASPRGSREGCYAGDRRPRASRTKPVRRDCMLISRRTAVLSALATPALVSRAWSQTTPDKIRLGQPTNSLSFLNTFASRALNSFAGDNIALEYASVPGADPAAVAPVDSCELHRGA